MDYGVDRGNAAPPVCSTTRRLTPLVAAIVSALRPDAGFYRTTTGAAAMRTWRGCHQAEFGYKLHAARQERARPYVIPFFRGRHPHHHPLPGSNMTDGLFSTLHEAADAMYEQGINPAYDGTPLGARHVRGRARKPVTRMWENLVGRSRPSGSTSARGCKGRFPTQLADVSPEDIVSARSTRCSPV